MWQTILTQKLVKISTFFCCANSKRFNFSVHLVSVNCYLVTMKMSWKFLRDLPSIGHETGKREIDKWKEMVLLFGSQRQHVCNVQNDGVVYRRGRLLWRNIVVLYIPALVLTPFLDQWYETNTIGSFFSCSGLWLNSKPGFYFITDYVPVPASTKDQEMVLIGG